MIFVIAHKSLWIESNFKDSPSGCGAKNLRTQLVFNCVKALVSCNGKT